MLCKNHSTPAVSLDFYTTIFIPLSCFVKFLNNSHSSLTPLVTIIPTIPLLVTYCHSISGKIYWNFSFLIFYFRVASDTGFCGNIKSSEVRHAEVEKWLLLWILNKRFQKLQNYLLFHYPILHVALVGGRQVMTIRNHLVLCGSYGQISGEKATIILWIHLVSN